MAAAGSPDQGSLRAASEIVAHMRRCPDPDPVARCPYLRAQMDAVVEEALARA